MSSPVVARLVSRWGERQGCMLGALLSAPGLLISSHSSSILTLILGYSVITGVGFGLMYLPSIVIVPKYFTRRHRSLATSVVLCAAGNINVILT